MGLGDFAKGLGDAAVNLGKGALYVADPRHADDIGEGIAKAGKFVVENPGKTWDVGFEVGRAVVKDQMDPMNLAINAGLLAATVATGGAAAPVWAAKIGLGAKSLQAGVTAAKGVDAGLDIAKGVKTATTAYKAGSAALKGAKAVEEVGDVVGAVRTGTKVVEAVDTASDAGKNLSRGQRFMQEAKQLGTGLKEGTATERFDKAMSLGTELKGAARESMGMSRYGAIAERRAAMGQKALTMGEDSGKVGQGLSKYAARKLGGETNPLMNPSASTSLSRAGRRINQAQDLATTPDVGKVQRNVEFAADPGTAIEKRAMEEIDKRAGKGSGYTDIGQTTTSLYQPTPPGQPPGASAYGQGPGFPMEALPSGQTQTQAQSPFAAAGAPPAGPPPGGFPGAAPPAGPPPGGSSGAAPPGGPPPTAGPAGPSAPNVRTGSRTAGRRASDTPPKGMHFWEGPRSQWAGGIKANYDWRPVDPLRPITSVKQGPSMVENYRKQQAEGGEAQGPLNEQGAPSNFAPEVAKSGMYAMSAGQQPLGALNPGQPTGLDANRSRMYLNDVQTSQQSEPVGAIGPQKSIGPGPASSRNSSAIDVSSSSPGDFGEDLSGQGFMDFRAMGSGTKDVGQQPNLLQPIGGPPTTYAQGTRAQRRREGQSTTGMNPSKLGGNLF